MFKDILKNLMEEKGINQRPVKFWRKYSAHDNQRLAQRRSFADYNALIKLSNYFEISADYLLGLEDDLGHKQP